MPLVTLAVAAYIAGLLAGFGGVLGSALFCAFVGMGAGALRRDARLAGLSGVFAAGALLAVASDAQSTHCRVEAVRAERWTAVLDDAAAPGAFVPATITLPGCAVRAWIAVQDGRAPAGAQVHVAGSALASTRGITVSRARLSNARGGSTLLAWRAGVGARIDAIFRTDAPLVRALVIADTRSLDHELRDRFAAAGIVHMLAISGLHVGIIAAAMRLVLIALRLPRASALAATVLVTAAYIALIGAPPAALRAGVMLGVMTISRLMQRATSPWAALAIGAAVPLGQASTVLDIGWQLSVIGMVGLFASSALSRRVVVPHLSGWRARVADMLLTSVVASAVSAPLVTWYFGRLSLISPLANIAASPVIALLQPTLFLAVLCSAVPMVGGFVADAARPMLAALAAVAQAGASAPYGSVVVAPTLASAVLLGVATVALVMACMSRFPVRPVIVAGASLVVALWLPLVPQRARGVELHAIDVGQGDAIALRTPLGRWILVDAGRAWRGGDAGRATVIPYLRRRGGDVALFVLSHPHADHVGGAPSVLQALRPAAYWDGAYVGTTDPYRASLLAARETSVRWQRTHPGDTLVIDGVHLTVLAPDSAWMSSLTDPNAASVVLLARYGAVRFLLMGDAEHTEERWLLERMPELLRADVLKVGHHGSSTSSTEPFLRAVAPRLALVSVGAGNTYGHPSASVMAALARAGAVVLRTDRVGSVVVRTNGATLEVDGSGESWSLSRVPSPP